jgi:hypothetical protein
MQPFATDTDLLQWEPKIMLDATALAQPMLSGTGNLEGTTFTITDSGDVTLSDAHVGAGHVIVLSGAISGSFPVLSIVNPTKLNLSVLYDEILTPTDAAPASAVGFGEALNFSIRTFWPQRQAATEAILAIARIKPGDAEAIIMNPQALRRPCALAAMQIVHTALAASAEDPENERAQADLYGRLFHRALRAVSLELDFNGDGRVDHRRTLSALTARRV